MRIVPWRRRARHPELSSPLALRLGGWSLWGVIGAYLALVATWVLVGVLFLLVVMRRSDAVSELVRQALAAMWSPSDLLDVRGEPLIFYVYAAANAVVGVLLPVFVLGAFVFKLFSQNPLVWRKRLTLEAHPTGQFVLAARFYNSLGEDLADLTIRAWLRYLPAENRTVYRNKPLALLLRGGHDDVHALPLAMPREPTTTRIVLGPTAVEGEPVSEGQLRIQDEIVTRADSTVILMVEGALESVNERFRSVKKYPLDGSGVDEGGIFQDIPLNADRKAPEWKDFDETQDMYLFVYGSLMRDADLEKANLGRNERQPGTLRGWRRGWNVASDPVSKNRVYRRPDGTEFGGWVVSLGLEPEEGAEVRGVLVKVGPRALGDFDLREQDYDRVDVSASVWWGAAGPPERFRVFTYVPKPRAVEAFERRLASGSPLAVSERYYQSVREAAESIDGIAGGFEEAAALRGVPVLPMLIEDAAVHPS